MSYPEMVERTLGQARKAADATQFAQGVKTIQPSREQLVGIRLMPHVPDNAVPGRVEDAQKRHGQFHDAKGRGQMAARGGNGLDDHTANFFAQPGQFLFVHALDVARFLDAGQNGKKFLQGLLGH